MRSAFLHVTNACNLRCFHCAYSSGAAFRTELTFAQIEKVAGYLRRQGGRAIMLGGGEPLVRPDLERILDMLVALDLEIKLETNLTVRSALVRQLPRFPKLTVVTSLDAMRPEVHDRQRGKRGSFAKTMANLLYLAARGVPVRINALMLESNVEDLDRYLELALECQVVFRPLFRPLPMGRWRAGDSLPRPLGVAGIAAALSRLVPFARADGQGLVAFYLPPALLPPDLIGAPYLCQWGHFLGVAADGSLAVCPAARGLDPFCGRSEETVEALTTGRLAFEQLSFVRLARAQCPDDLAGVCGRCIVRAVCRGGCRVSAYLERGRSTDPDPLCEAFFRAGQFPRYAIDEPIEDGAGG